MNTFEAKRSSIAQNKLLLGLTLRFLCRIKNEEILEPLISSVLENVEHRHSYVRRNVVLAIDSIFSLTKGELLIPDAPELIDNLLRNEQDLSAKRNAFAMLAKHSEERAVRYLIENIDQVHNFGDLLQMAVLDLIVQVRPKSDFNEKDEFLGMSFKARRKRKIFEDHFVFVTVPSCFGCLRRIHCFGFAVSSTDSHSCRSELFNGLAREP